MASQSIEHTKRQIRRARATLDAVTASPRPETAAVGVLGADFVAACAAFDRADEAVRDAQRIATRETAEALAALAPLAQQHDAARGVLQAKVGVVFSAASAYTTPDDLIGASEAIEHELDVHASEAWAPPIQSALGPVLDAALKEQAEGAAALKGLQKAQLAREQVAGALRPLFVGFRRAVRVAFGRSSREYQELRDRTGGGTDELDEITTSPEASPLAGAPNAPAPNAPPPAPVPGPSAS